MKEIKEIEEIKEIIVLLFKVVDHSLAHSLWLFD